MTYPITPNPAIHNEPSSVVTQQNTITVTQMQAMGQQMIEGITNAVLYFITGGIIGARAGSDSSTATGNLQAWFAHITGLAQNSLQQISQMIGSIEGQTIADLTAWWNGVEADASAAFTNLEEFLVTGDWNDLSAAVTDILHAIFGSGTNPSLVGSVSAPAVTNTTQSVQLVPNFPNAASVQPGGGWAWDGTTTYNDTGGSVRFIATGALGALRGVVAAVQPNQIVNLSAQVQWSGLVAGSNPIQIQLIPWSGATKPEIAGTPVTIAQISSPGASGSWTAPTPVIASGVSNGAYTVPASGVTFVQMRLVVQGATAGSVWFDNCLATVSGGFLSLLQDDLSDLQQDALQATAAWKTFWAAISTAITADAGNIPKFLNDAQTAWNALSLTLKTLEGAEIATLQQIVNSFLGLDPYSGLFPATQVQGVGGFQTIEDTFNTWVSQLGAALGGDVADAGGLAWLAQLMNDIGINSTSPLAPLSSSAQTSAQILATVNNRPASAGLEATVEANGDYHQAASLSGQLVTKTTSRGTCVTVSQAKTLGFVQWLGAYSTAPTGFVINFYKMNSSGNLVLLSTSPDLSATVSSGVAWYLWDLTTPITVDAGDVIGVEFQIKTSGGINAYGYTAPLSASHPTAAIKQLGFSQNWNGATASSISAGAIGWSQYAPYVGLGVGTPPPTPFFPRTTSFTFNNTYTIQSWADLVDLIALGAGGGGEGETGAGNGDGGVGGSWATKTLVVGTDIAAGGTITIIVGQGGAGGPYFTPGASGTFTRFTWTNPTLGTKTLTAAGGAGGQPTTNLTSWGLSPGNTTFAGSTYFGGGTNVVGGTGNYPGGGGTGGAAFQYGFAGANGEAWIVDRQTS